MLHLIFKLFRFDPFQFPNRVLVTCSCQMSVRMGLNLGEVYFLPKFLKIKLYEIFKRNWIHQCKIFAFKHRTIHGALLEYNILLKQSQSWKQLYEAGHNLLNDFTDDMTSFPVGKKSSLPGYQCVYFSEFIMAAKRTNTFEKKPRWNVYRK